MGFIPELLGSNAPIGPALTRRQAVVGRLFWTTLPAAFALLLFGAAPASAAGPTNLQELMSRLSAMPGLTADFREEKTLALLRERLMSEGTIYFSPPDQLARVVRGPVASRVVLDGDRLGFSGAGEGGIGGGQIAVDAYPMMALFVDSMRKILSGDLAGLEAIYRIDYEVAGDVWLARFEPTPPELRRALSELRLRGKGIAFEELVVVERNGDTTRMIFSGVDTQRRFDDAERGRLFGMPER